MPFIPIYWAYAALRHIISSSYCTFLRRQFQNTGAAAIKQTSKFSSVLQMFQETVSGHECRLASCSRCVGWRRQMICHIVQFLSAERRASTYQRIACQNDGCRPGDSTQLNTCESSHPILQRCTCVGSIYGLGWIGFRQRCTWAQTS